MYNMDYECVKDSLDGKVVNAHGSFEIIGKMVTPRRNDHQMALMERLRKLNPNIKAFEFEGEEPLKKLDFMKKVMAERTGNYSVLTSAPAELWEEFKEDGNWQKFERILIRRLHPDDIKNAVLLGANSIKREDYENMPEAIKKKISLVVDCKKAELKSLREAKKFIGLAQEIGVNEIIFNEDEEEITKFRKKLEEEKIIAQEVKVEQIKALREGRYKSKVISAGWMGSDVVKIEKPLFQRLQAFLFQNGFNFYIAKAIVEEKRFFSLIVLKKGNLRVVLKSKVTKHKEEIWDTSRSHKYVVKI